jgi:hypothetical protein
MPIKNSPSMLTISRREALNSVPQLNTLTEPGIVETAALAEAPNIPETPAADQLDNLKSPQLKATEATLLEPVLSFEDVKLAFLYAEKELIEVCVEAYTNKNFKLPLSYAPEDTPVEVLELRKQEMVA